MIISIPLSWLPMDDRYMWRLLEIKCGIWCGKHMLCQRLNILCGDGCKVFLPVADLLACREGFI